VTRGRLKLVALCIVGLVGAGIGAWLAGEAAIKARVSEAVFRATGRALVLVGPLSIRPGLSLSIVADDVSFANAPDGSRPEMARARRVAARVAWLPLFSREIVVERLTLVEPSVLLETNAEGVPNWRFPPPRSPGAGIGAGVPATPWNVDARMVELREGSVEWRDGRTHQGAKTLVPRLILEAASAASPVSLSGEVQWGGARAGVTGQFGSAASFRSATAASPWPVRVVAESAMERISVAGGIARPASFAGLIAVTAPQGDVSGDIAWRFAGRPMLEANLSSKRLDLDAVRAILAARPAPPPAGPVGQSADPVHAPPDPELPFAALNRMDGDVRLAVSELRLAGVTLVGFVGHAVLREGKLALDPVGGQGAGGRLDMTASVDASVAEPPVTVSLRGDGIAVKPVLAAFGWPGDVLANANVSVDLRGQGRTIHALAAGLDGHVALAIADGEVDNNVFSAALGGFMRAARLPAEFGAGRTSIRCLAVRLDAAHGLVAATTMLLDTRRLTLQGMGEVDLASERVALRLRPLVRIGGTLREPKVTLDSGGLLGALMAGERRVADPCPPALANARLP